MSYPPGQEVVRLASVRAFVGLVHSHQGPTPDAVIGGAFSELTIAEKQTVVEAIKQSVVSYRAYADRIEALAAALSSTVV